MADELVTVSICRDLPEALIAQGKLQALGIASFLADEEVRTVWCAMDHYR